MSWQLQHLQLRLRPIHRALDALASQAQSSLRTLDALVSSGRTGLPRCRLEDDECAEEQHIRARAKASDIALPLDVFGDELDLDPFELEVIVLCAAVELDPAYGRVLAEIQRDTILRRPTIGLAAALTASTLAERVGSCASRAGSVICRRGFRNSRASARAASHRVSAEPPHTATVIACAVLARSANGASSFRSVRLAVHVGSSQGSEKRCGDCPSSTPRASDVRTSSASDSASDVAAWTKPNRRNRPSLPSLPRRSAGVLGGAAADAYALGAALWIDLDRLSLPEDTITAVLESSLALLIITARQATRPPRLVARGFVECQLAAPSFADRRAMWCDAVPDLPDAQADMLAGRYRLDQTAIAAVAVLARTTRPDAVTEVLDEAAASIAQPRSLRFADVIAPRRKFDALVLPPSEERQVRELAETYLVWRLVSRSDGDSRLPMLWA